MSRVTFTGPINEYTGYGKHSIQIIRDIERLSGAYVSVRAVSVSDRFGAAVPLWVRRRLVNDVQPEQWELMLHPPTLLPTPSKRTLYFSMWESTKLPPSGPRMLNQAEAVVVPCQWNATIFSSCGVEKPIHIIPLGIDETRFFYHPYAQNQTYESAVAPVECVFGTAGRMAHGGTRKGINHVIDLFGKAFPDEKDVRLEVKCFPDCQVVKPADPRVSVHQEYWTDDRLAAWYRDLTCFVSAARSEGWGLMQHQAMYTGRPVIGVNFGGVSEFFNGQVGYAVDYELEPAQFHYTGCGLWAHPKEDSMIEAMRRVYENRVEAIQKGLAAHEAVKHLTWENHSRKLVGLMERLGML